jgi:hypothetical protein
LYNKAGTVYHESACKFIQAARLVIDSARTRPTKAFPGTWVYAIEGIAGLDGHADAEEERPSSRKKSRGRLLKRTFRQSGVGGNSSMAQQQTEDEPAQNLVWAKIKGYPYYPARVVSVGKATERRTIPKSVVKALKGKQQNIVRFFDKEKAWAAISRDTLITLKADFESELQRIPGMNRLGSKVVEDLRRAHLEALESMH